MAALFKLTPISINKEQMISKYRDKSPWNSNAAIKGQIQRVTKLIRIPYESQAIRLCEPGKMIGNA